MIELKNINKTYAKRKATYEVVLWYSSLRISLPIFVAVEKKLFRKYWIDISLQRFDTAQPLINALVEWNIDVWGYCAMPIIERANKYYGDVIAYTTYIHEDDSHPISYFLRRNSLIIQEDDRSQLVWKRIGVLPTDAYGIRLEMILDTHYIKKDDVQILPISPLKQVESLEAWAVDFLFTNDPAATTIIQNKKGKLFSKYVGIHSYTNSDIFGSFMLSRTFLEEQWEVSERVVRALDEAIQYCNTYPKRVKQYIKPYIDTYDRKYVYYYPDTRYSMSQKFSQTPDHKNYYIPSGTKRQQWEDQLFSNFNIAFKSWQVIGLFGANWTWKSTLLGIIWWIDTAYEWFWVSDTVLRAYVHQKPLQTLLPWYTCHKNILLACKYNNISSQEAKDRLNEIVKWVWLDFSLYKYPLELSGWQQQLVTILRAMVLYPQLLVMDEPFSALDISKRKNVIAYLKQYAKIHNSTIVLCSHKWEELLNILDRVVVLWNKPVTIIDDIERSKSSAIEFECFISWLHFW